MNNKYIVEKSEGKKEKGGLMTGRFKKQRTEEREIWLMRNGKRDRLRPLFHQSAQNYTFKGPGGTPQ
jgi:hypothetical protein